MYKFGRKIDKKGDFFDQNYENFLMSKNFVDVNIISVFACVLFSWESDSRSTNSEQCKINHSTLPQPSPSDTPPHTQLPTPQTTSHTVSHTTLLTTIHTSIHYTNIRPPSSAFDWVTF